MNAEEAEKVVRLALGENMGDDEAEAPLDASLLDDIGLDDLDRVEFVLTLEKRIGISIPDETVDSWDTLADVIDSVYELTNKV